VNLHVVEGNPFNALKRCDKCRAEHGRKYRREYLGKWRKDNPGHRVNERRHAAAWYAKTRKNDPAWIEENKRRAKLWRERNKEHVREYRKRYDSTRVLESS